MTKKIRILTIITVAILVANTFFGAWNLTVAVKGTGDALNAASGILAIIAGTFTAWALGRYHYHEHKRKLDT